MMNAHSHSNCLYTMISANTKNEKNVKKIDQFSGDSKHFFVFFRKKTLKNRPPGG